MKLHIGGKEAHPDWKILNVLQAPEVDFIGNASNLEQFEDDSIEAIYASHVLEHFNHGWNNELLNTLHEWYRVLQPGGKLYLSVPDLRVICELFLHPNLMPTDKLYLMRIMFGGQIDEYDVHKVGFDADILALYLDKVGFYDYEKVTQFNLFKDSSCIKVLDRFISLNIIATKSFNSPTDTYNEYLKQYFSNIIFSKLPLFKSAKQSDYVNPTTPLELNNFAVINIIEAENTEDISLREFYLDLAIEALETALNIEENHLLCIAHLGIIKHLLGETNTIENIEYSTLLELLPMVFLQQNTSPAGLVYLPIRFRNKAKNKANLQKIIGLDNSYLQGFYLLVADLEQSQMIFDNDWGLRFLNFANQIIPDSAHIKLNLGISSFLNTQNEGLLYLYQAQQLEPNNSRIIQALYLSSRDFNNQQLANTHYQYGNNYYQQNSENICWKWASLPFENSWTYVPFDSNLLMAVEASFNSIVTAVLLAQEDWFETEMELWRNEIKPGMTVIDVGANVGVYTFSAAQRVGKKGKVFAVEPFSGCVECLEETRRVNKLDWVNICAGAAGDSNKTVKLSLHQARELNEIIKDDSPVEGQYQEVECFALDSLVEKYQLSTVDWLKIDAEGHEMQVLQGSTKILSDFKPKILYENIAGNQGNNVPVAQYLLSIGYELFYYQPFLKQLIQLQSLDELAGKLNIIALPSTSSFN